MLVYWKHPSHPDFVGENIEFFKVAWSGTQWLRDIDGKWWGVEHPNGRRNIRLMGEPENYGEAIEEKSSDISVPKLELGRPELQDVGDLEDLGLDYE